MIPGDLLSQLQLLIRASAPPLIEVARTSTSEVKWVPGQHLIAMVLASLPNGRFQVKVGDIALDMNLPRNTQPGTQVELTFVSNQPRLTFALARDWPAAAGNRLPPDANGQVTLSDSVRYLGALLEKISNQTEPRAAPLGKTAPLLSAAPADAREFAAALRNALSQSGLFYESHQAQWVAGARTLTAMLQEPQAGLSALHPDLGGEIARGIALRPGVGGEVAREIALKPGVGSEVAQGVAPKPEAGGEIAQRIAMKPEAGAAPAQKNAPASAPSVGLPAHTTARTPVNAEAVLFYASQQTQRAAAQTEPGKALREPQSDRLPPGLSGEAERVQKGASASTPADGVYSHSAARMPVHADAVSLVQQQLRTLDSGQLVWQGQVWQGQPMEWRVEERRAPDEAAGDADTPHWQTSLRLQLPRMGEVWATLAFLPPGLRIDLLAGDGGSAEAMKGAQDKLRGALEASGLKVLAMSVARHEKT